MARVAVLGLGAMGSRMARNAAQAGHAVTVWNRSPGPVAALGLPSAATPHAAVAEADLVLSMVRDDAASQSVWLDPLTGALQGLRQGAIAIESSTLSIATMQALGQAIEAAGGQFLDAPVVGSRPQAEAAQLVHLVGGSPQALAAAEPLLSVIGARSIHAGGIGAGTALKLAVNALFAIQVATMAELIGQLAAADIDLAVAIEAIGSLPVCSPAAKVAAGAMLAGSFQPQFPVDLVEKDLGYAAGAATPLITAARAVFADAAGRGWGGLNLTAVAQLYR